MTVMRKTHSDAISKLLAVSAVVLTIAGCSNGMADEPQTQVQSDHAHHAKTIHDSSVIPSENGPKQYTTNKQGHTTSGMGTNVYSMIGSSGLNASGFSAHLESRLSGAGIPDVRVFVFDDTVILAAEKREASASEYDAVQRKVLDQTEGMSSKGYSPDSGLGGMKGTDQGAHDNLSMAASRIKSFIGADVKVLTVTGPKAVQAIEQIREGAMADNISPAKLAASFRTLLELAIAGGRQ
ncbi:hypothetical protein [Paenibacillus harenae]|uniref:Sporulation protein n=1 Tax=Paenibacillus harenae TaxID=306543 RepID=A0ABT9U5G0_PAEHA|nr:hypothetical protein [Paenibacillus harenae]MDQ0114813.1 hypothetical protein [Paenibacillus harenae]